MDLELDGKVTLITGGTDGLGEALGHRLIAERGKVAICGRDLERLASALAGLTEAGGDVIGVPADVTVPADLARFVDQAIQRWGRIDALVNNAGRSAAGGIESVTDEEWQADFELKVLAAVRLTRLVVPQFRAVGGGAIINVLNTGAKAPAGSSSPTTSSRAAGLALTKTLSKELGPDQIRVNAICVGAVESGQWRRRAEDGRPIDEIYSALSAGVPLGRVGRAAEFADLAAYLLSERASYVTGTAINLDGGASPVY